MNPSELEQHRFHRSRFETSLMKMIEEDKLWRSAFKCIFTELSTLTHKNMFGKEINHKYGFYIRNPKPEWIDHLNSKLDPKFVIVTDRIVRDNTYYYLSIRKEEEEI